MRPWLGSSSTNTSTFAPRKANLKLSRIIRIEEALPLLAKNIGLVPHASVFERAVQEFYRSTGTLPRFSQLYLNYPFDQLSWRTPCRTLVQEMSAAAAHLLANFEATPTHGEIRAQRGAIFRPPGPAASSAPDSYARAATSNKRCRAQFLYFLYLLYFLPFARS